MSNYINFSIQTREQIKNYILSKLGYPLITVEITDEQLDIVINEAVEEFTKYVTQEKKWLGYDLSTYNETSGFILPSNVTSIFALEENNVLGGTQGGINTLFSVQNAMWSQGFFPTFIRGDDGGAWVTYELAMQYIDLVKRMTGGGFQFEYYDRTKQLLLYPNPKKLGQTGWVCFGCNTLRDDDYQYGESWVKRYSLALAKQIIGEIRIKYGSTPLLAGGSIDTSMKDEGRSEQERYLEELMSTYKYVDFFVG